MRIYQEADYEGMSRRAANLISAEVIRSPTVCWVWPPAPPLLAPTSS